MKIMTSVAVLALLFGSSAGIQMSLRDKIRQKAGVSNIHDHVDQYKEMMSDPDELLGSLGDMMGDMDLDMGDIDFASGGDVPPTDVHPQGDH